VAVALATFVANRGDEPGSRATPFPTLAVSQNLAPEFEPFPTNPAGGGEWSMTARDATGVVWEGRLYFSAPGDVPWKACGTDIDDQAVAVRAVFTNRSAAQTMRVLYTLQSVAPNPFDGVVSGQCQTGAVVLSTGTGEIPPGGTRSVDGYLILRDPATQAAATAGTWHARPIGNVTATVGAVPSAGVPVREVPETGPILP
jgi:hypothetical protein